MLRVLAHAKINWYLGIERRRGDGYHDVDMLLQSITLADELTFSKGGEGIRLDCAPLPGDRRNIAFRAAQRLLGRSPQPGFYMHIAKNIPLQAGLGGGSADAAAALIAADRLFKLGTPTDALEAIALELGADVPFMLRGGMMRARGIGEALEMIDAQPPRIPLVVAQPAGGLSTRDVYEGLRESDFPLAGDMESLIGALKSADARQVAKHLYNALEPVSTRLLPDIAALKRRLLDLGALGALMSGSGSAVFGVFDSAGAAQAAVSALQGAGVAAWFAVPAPHSIQFTG